MADETYYTVLNVEERATPAEIKTAYRDLIKQIHPDTIANLAPYLQQIAEDKTKEITEAYAVLSNSSKRRDYDRQLAEYRRQTMPQAPPASQPTPSSTASTAPFGYCNMCGTSLDASGNCPKCSKSATSAATPTASPPRPQVVRWLGYNWAPIMHWSREHPILILAASVFLVLVIVSAISGNGTSSQSDLNCAPSQRAEVNGRFACQAAAPTAQAASANSVVTRVKPTAEAPASLVSGTYVGTVHNQTVNLSSTCTVVLRQTKDGVLSGCMEVRPPLYGSGTLRGSLRGSQANFVVSDITFQGNASRDGIAGSYVVTQQGGNQLGDFHLTKQEDAQPYHCVDDGALSAASQTISVVPRGYKALIPAANSASDGPAIPSKSAATAPEGTKEPDLSNLTYAEQESIVSACSYAKLVEGPAMYDHCLVRQFETLAAAPKKPDLSGLTYSEQQSAESACSYAKVVEGPASYNRCLVRQLEAWTTAPKVPDLSSLTFSEKQSVESACSYSKIVEGPAAYNRCLVRQLQALNNYHR